jgi:long-chain acyl-CoA synthetase
MAIGATRPKPRGADRSRKWLAAHGRHRPHRRGGRIVITDRKKDMIVNDKGDNISPQLEGMLTLQPEIAQAMVIGDKPPYVVGLIVPDAEWSLEWAVAR